MLDIIEAESMTLFLVTCDMSHSQTSTGSNSKTKHRRERFFLHIQRPLDQILLPNMLEGGPPIKQTIFDWRPLET
jgi:hypothetical protein